MLVRSFKKRKGILSREQQSKHQEKEEKQQQEQTQQQNQEQGQQQEQLENQRLEQEQEQEPKQQQSQEQGFQEDQPEQWGLQKQEEPQEWELQQQTQFQQWEQPRIPERCPPGFRDRYTVVSGDTMFQIARRFDISLDSLIEANPHIPNPNRLIVGDVLCVPGEPVFECPPGTDRYVVEPGDTMIEIARRFGVTLEALIGNNPQIENPNLIFPGDVLCIPIGRPLLPCCIILSIRELDISGSAVFFGALGRFSVGVLVQNAPPPDEFGNFNGYVAQVIVPDVDIYEAELCPVMSEPTLRAGRLIFTLPEGRTELPVTTQVYVRPLNLNTGEVGVVILRGSLQDCV